MTVGDGSRYVIERKGEKLAGELRWWRMEDVGVRYVCPCKICIWSEHQGQLLTGATRENKPLTQPLLSPLFPSSFFLSPQTLAAVLLPSFPPNHH